MPGLIFENMFKLRFVCRQMLFLIYLIIFFFGTMSIAEASVKTCTH